MYWTDPYPRPELTVALRKTKNSHFLERDGDEVPETRGWFNSYPGMPILLNATVFM